MSYTLPQYYFNSFGQNPYFMNTQNVQNEQTMQNQSQTIPQIYSTPILQEVPPNKTNVQKLDEFENIEELCTNECHSDSCKCNTTNYDNCNESDESEEESETEPETEPETESESEETEKVHSESCECTSCFTSREEYIIKTQKELEEKLKIQRMQRERIEKEKKEKEKTEKRKNLIEKINKVVGEYNEQSKKCDQLLKTYNTENMKLTQLNTEYYKLKYQLDTIEQNNKNVVFDDFSKILYPFLDILRK